MTHTLESLSAALGIPYNTLYKRARTRIPSRTWAKESPLSALDVETLSVGGTVRAEKPRKIRRSVPAKSVPAVVEISGNMESAVQDVPAFDKRLALSVVRSGILLSVVIGHAALVWYDCTTLWGVPGMIGGGLVFAIVVAAVMFAADPLLPRTSGWAMWFVALVDGAAFWVHKPVFDGYGQGVAITSALCMFVCACSFAALYMFRDSKLD